MDLTDLLMALPPVGRQTSIQLHPARRLAAQGVGGQDASLMLRLPCYCAHCDLRYETTWFTHKSNPGEGHCFFCHRFRTPRITRFALLRETEWFFLQSGGDEGDKRAFYEAYFFYLHRWADRFCFDRTQEEVEYQEELLRGLLDSEMSD